jgi:hypothetical protein
MRDAFFASLILSGCTLLAACTLNTHPQLGATDSSLMCIVSPSSCDAGAATPIVTGQAGEQGGKASPPQGGTIAGTPAVTAGAGGMSVPTTGGAGGTLAMSGGMGGMTPAAPLLEAGKLCTDDKQCLSAHCEGVCCAGGDCCTKVSECNLTKVNGMDLACNDLTTCQGSGGAVECTSDFRCVAKGGAADDSACGTGTLANNCGPYPPVYCNGQVSQTAPACATSCRAEGDCDATAHCDNQICVADIPNGGSCIRNVDCESNHCNSGVCCASGDCCPSTPLIGVLACPASYSAAATCDQASCQGNSRVATCVNSQCGTMMIADDSACISGSLVNECGAYKNVTCTGGSNQPMASGCANSCTNNAGCDANAFCRNNRCEAKVADGQPCQNNNNCEHNFCGTNMRCCSDTGGQCCTDANQCTDGNFSTSMCTNPTMCMGVQNMPACRAGTCVAEPSPSPAPCMDQTNACPVGYAPITAKCPMRCKTSCTGAADCSTGFECKGSTCQLIVIPTGGTGGGAGAAGEPPIDQSSN